MGTNLLKDWYYPIHGISLIDIALIFNFIFYILTIPADRLILKNQTKLMIKLLLILFLWLTILNCIAAVRGFGIDKILSQVRIIYFISLIIIIIKELNDIKFIRLIITGFLIGVLVIFFQDFLNVEMEHNILGILILSNPNVIGAMLGWSVYMCSIMTILGKSFVFFSLSLFIASLSITTFSKGAWIMVVLGIFCNLLALHINFKENYKNIIIPYYLLFILIIMVIFIYDDRLMGILQFKINSTYDVGSFDIRKNFIFISILSALENPIFGMGIGNFYQVKSMYPDIQMPELLPEDNSHNIFSELVFSGGFPALFLFCGILVNSLWQLWKLLEICSGSKFLKKIYLFISGLFLFIWGSIQLQIMAQPVFWFWVALIVAIQIQYNQKNKYAK